MTLLKLTHISNITRVSGSYIYAITLHRFLNKSNMDVVEKGRIPPWEEQKWRGVPKIQVYHSLKVILGNIFCRILLTFFFGRSFLQDLLSIFSGKLLYRIFLGQSHKLVLTDFVHGQFLLYDFTDYFLVKTRLLDTEVGRSLHERVGSRGQQA